MSDEMSDVPPDVPERGNDDSSEIADQSARHVSDDDVDSGESHVFKLQREIRFEGPLPPPALLEEYERIHPGAAEHIFARTESEQKFRHEFSHGQAEFENRALYHAAVQGYMSRVLAFIITLVAIGGGIWLIASDKGTAGLVSLIAALVSLVAVFITGKVFDQKADATSAESDPSEAQ